MAVLLGLIAWMAVAGYLIWYVPLGSPRYKQNPCVGIDPRGCPGYLPPVTDPLHYNRGTTP